MSYCIVKRPRPKFVTYKHKDKLVFVTPASNYEEALDMAQKEFPKLAKVPRERIIFNVFVVNRESNSQQPIRISPEAWSPTIDNASPGQVINIDVLPSTKKFWNFKLGTSEESAETSQQVGNANSSS